MAFTQRQVKNYFSTSLLVPALITDTTMRSPDFVGLDADYGEKYLALTLRDDSLGVFEIVWVSGHSSGSDTVTVARGKELTTARAWGAGTRIECAPTEYDTILARSSTTLPSDPAIGTRVERLDTKDVLERGNGVWGPSVGVGIAADQGNNMHGVNVPDGAVLLFRCGTAGGTTDASGKLPCTFKTPFPNGCLAISAHSTFFNAFGQLVLSGLRNSGADLNFIKPDGTRLANATASYSYMAIGW